MIRDSDNHQLILGYTTVAALPRLKSHPEFETRRGSAYERGDSTTPVVEKPQSLTLSFSLLKIYQPLLTLSLAVIV